MKNVIFQPADRRQESFIPLSRDKSFIAFLPCRMAMAFACQPLIAGRQKKQFVTIRGQPSAFLFFKVSVEYYLHSAFWDVHPASLAAMSATCLP
jgi:hypothetical protein